MAMMTVKVSQRMLALLRMMMTRSLAGSGVAGEARQRSALHWMVTVPVGVAAGVRH